MNKKYWLKYIDDTAHPGIRVQADSKGDLFTRAAWGMFSLMTDMNTVNSEHKTVLAVKGVNLSSLMVNWLTQLNALHTSGQRLFSKFEIQEMSQIYLKAEAASEAMDSDRHVIDTGIKAVSSDDLEVEYVDGTWHAQIRFEV